ncbi:MAG: HEAT repeat domain-containing protein [Planctomycetes bacterium]|nr:HEAT repeat domain-containing protein [Planctomycetota bacterium]
MRIHGSLFAGGMAALAVLLLCSPAAQAGVSFSLSIGGGHGHFGGYAGSGYFYYSCGGWGFGNHSYAWPYHTGPHGPAWHHPGPVYWHGSPHYRTSRRVVAWPRLTSPASRYWWNDYYGGSYQPYSGYRSYYVTPGAYVYVDEPVVYEEPIVVRRVYRVAETPEADDKKTDNRTDPSSPGVNGNVRRDEPAAAAKRTGSWADGEWRVSSDERQRVARDIERALGKTAQQTAAKESQATEQPAATREAAYRNDEAELLHLLCCGKEDQREDAAEKLKRFSTPRVVEALSEALARDSDDDVREAAAESLGSMLAKDALKALRHAAQFDSDRSVRRQARQAVDKIEAYKD